MGYVNKTYLSTQFKNFADKIAKVFSKIGHTHLKSDITDFPTSMPANGGNAATVGGHTVGVNVPSNAKFTDTTYSKLSEFTDDVGYVKNTDARLSDARNAKDVYAWAKASTKPTYTANEVGLGNVGNFKAVSTVASQGLSNTEKSNARANIGAGTSSFSGSYNDLTNKPTIPTNNNQLTNGAGYITSSGTAKTISDTLPISKGGTGQTTAVNAANTLINSLSTGESTPTDADYYISQYVGGGTKTTTYHRRPMSALWNYIKSKLATVATSGSYNDLKNKPTIPSVGNGTVTIKQAGTSKGTFTMNQSGNTTIELTDNNTWRGIQNNLTSNSTTDSLSAAQGKVLKGLVDGKAASSHTHTKSQITDFPTSLPASDVYSWAKASKKPSYTKTEVGLGNVDNTADSAKTVYAAQRMIIQENRIDGNLESFEFNPEYSREHLGTSSFDIVGYDKENKVMTYGNSIDAIDTRYALTTFKSNDSTTGDSTPPSLLASGETHASIFSKVSTIFKNVRWLLSKMGTTDISSIGNGTVTGALSTLNSNKVGSHAYILSDLKVGMTFASPAILYLVNDNVNKTGNVAIDFAGNRFWLTSGGIGQNNTHFIPAGAVVKSITNLNTAAYCYLA